MSERPPQKAPRRLFAPEKRGESHACRERGSVPPGAVIRAAVAADFPAILALNAESVHFLSPMDRSRLEHLHAQAAYHRVVDFEGQLGAFLLAFREGAEYDSPNYIWFSQRYDRFLYVDRVVVAAAQQGKRLGALLYQDLFEFARGAAVPRITCEFDVEPANEVSRRFHAALGFREVGSQWVGGGKKKVSLQEADPGALQL